MDIISVLCALVCTALTFITVNGTLYELAMYLGGVLGMQNKMSCFVFLGVLVILINFTLTAIFFIRSIKPMISCDDENGKK